MKDAPLLHAAEAGAFHLLRGCLRALPHGRTRAIGRRLGDLAHSLLGSRRRLARANVEAALPELDAGDCRQVVRGAFRQMMTHAAEFLSWERFGPRELCERWSLEGWEHTVGDGRPRFFMTAHFGYWELLGRPLPLYHPPVAALVRPLDNPRLDRYVDRARTAFGLRLIHKHGAARAITRALRQGTSMIVLVDQRVPPRDAVTVPFFGRPALTTNLLARLALAHHADVVPIYVYPAPHGRYRIVARAPISADSIDGADPVVDLTRRYMAAVEAEIRASPARWLWMHDRWRMP